MKAKPCASCGHAKSKHRKHECRAAVLTRGLTFTGIRAYVKYCMCRGYVSRDQAVAA